MNGCSLASGSSASLGALAGVITAITPGCARAAASFSAATRPRAMLLTAITA